MEQKKERNTLNLSLNTAFSAVGNKANSMARVAPDLVSATQLKYFRREPCTNNAASNVFCLPGEPEEGVP